MTTGTYDISSLLKVRFQSVKEFGLDTIRRVLEDDLAAHNIIMQDMVTEFCEVTTDVQRKYGSSASNDMAEVDEYGRAPGQKIATGATCGFPLRLFQFPVGWTEKWMEVRTPADMAQATIDAEKAHMRQIQRQIKMAIMLSANYTFNDFLVDKIDLAVKRLVNADSAPIPDGPNGETFNGATHTHYLARVGGALAATDVTGLINTVVEHGFGGAVRIAINKADEATVRALSGFTAYQDPRLILGISTNQPGVRLDISRLDNRAIGIFGAAEVWVKPWVPANYMICWDSANPNKPLAFRQRSAQSLQGLRIAATMSSFPLVAEFMEAEFGIGVWTRTNGAVLYFGGVAYADPAL